jgi:hypothetical protein
MASRDLFNIAHSPAVAPIPCIECGNNMHCVRRQPAHAGERQMFVCAACGNASERTVGLQESDADIQCAVETSLGIVRRTG